MALEAVEQIRLAIPEPAKDMRLNLTAVLESGPPLTVEQRWGVALATAMATKSARLRDALLADLPSVVAEGAALVDEARAAATLMAMNNVYYRFRHFMGKEAYDQMPARLRMQRLARPSTNKLDLELFCLAVSAVNGCQMCVQAHEKVLLDGGFTVEHIHEAVRIAAVMAAVAQSLELGVDGATS